MVGVDGSCLERKVIRESELGERERLQAIGEAEKFCS
jgi:hypothetical protein